MPEHTSATTLAARRPDRAVRAALTILVAASLTVALASCSMLWQGAERLVGGEQSQQDPSSDPEREDAAIAEVVSAEVSDLVSVESLWATTGLRSGLVVNITRSVAAPLTTDQLDAILRGTWQNAIASPSQISVNLFTTSSGEPEPVSFDESADALDMGDYEVGWGRTFMEPELAARYGEWQPS